MNATKSTNATGSAAVGARAERVVGRLAPERDSVCGLTECAGKPMCKRCASWADADVLACQVISLREALLKVLETREKEAKAFLAWQTAYENFSGGARLESRQHLAAMTASSTAEKEARLLLATLKTPNVK